MDFGSSFLVTQEEFNLFYGTDRELYKILVINLSREPEESMQVYAMWLWLEKMGYPKVVKGVLSLPNILINEVAEETVICLRKLNNNNLAGEITEIPLLQSLLDKELSLQILYDNRDKALQGIAKVVQQVCVRAFHDIMQQAQAQAQAQKTVTQTSSGSTHLHDHFCWFGSIGPTNLRVENNNFNRQQVVPADERTLFVTFSKGYPVQEWEVKEFLVMAYGDCIESLYMQEVLPGEQALFARIVFRTISTIEKILGGASKVKFAINGKHVWARKYVPKRNATRTFGMPTTSSGESSSSTSGS